MIKIVFIVVALVILAAVVEFFREGESKRAPYQYKKKNYFMSRAEHECFDALMVAVGDKYHVFPQVHLPTIIDSKVVGQNWNGAFRHISQKSVDFVLCNKGPIQPVLAIELDDKTHERQDRIDRDGEVERILKNASIPLLRLQNHGHFDTNDLATKISEILSSNL